VPASQLTPDANPGPRRRATLDASEPMLRTEQTLMRRWRASDLEPFAALNADADVMEHFPTLLTRAESDAMVERIEACFEQSGYGLWAVELPGEAAFVGFVGLWPVRPELPFAPALEIGWRLAAPYWGRGIATEAARAAMAFAFEDCDLDSLVSYTAATNVRSMRVMARLGMRREPADDFEHPQLEEGNPLRPHIVYRIDRARWESERVAE